MDNLLFPMIVLGITILIGFTLVVCALLMMGYFVLRAGGGSLTKAKPMALPARASPLNRTVAEDLLLQQAAMIPNFMPKEELVNRAEDVPLASTKPYKIVPKTDKDIAGGNGSGLGK